MQTQDEKVAIYLRNLKQAVSACNVAAMALHGCSVAVFFEVQYLHSLTVGHPIAQLHYVASMVLESE